MAVTSISGHFCLSEFREISPLPVCDILQTVSSGLQASGHDRGWVLGTKGVMESRLFGGITTAEVVAPTQMDLDLVHDAYVTIALAGEPDPASAEVLIEAGRRLVRSEQVDAVLLGGTDLVLVMDGPEVDYPVVDCAGLHVEALAALAGQPAPGRRPAAPTKYAVYPESQKP